MKRRSIFQPRGVGVAALALAALFAGTAARADYWGTWAERPPRLGDWYYIQTPAPMLDFLLPPGDVAVRPTPWTPAWYTYCKRKYTSFDPKTGTVVTPDGVRMCH